MKFVIVGIAFFMMYLSCLSLGICAFKEYKGNYGKLVNWSLGILVVSAHVFIGTILIDVIFGI